MPVTALLELCVTAIIAGLICFLITSRLDDRRWRRQRHEQLADYATWFLDTGLDDAVARWADTM
jgi:hypothetical protein